MQFGLSQGALETIKAFDSVGQMQRTCDCGQLFMTQLKQASCGVVGALFVIGSDTIAAPVGRKPVDTDDTAAGFAVAFCLHREVAEVGRNHDETCGEVSTQLIEVYQFFGMVIVGVAQDQPIAIGERHVFRAANHRGKEGIGNVRDDHPDHVGLVAPEAARKLVGLVPSSLNGFQHAFSHRLPDAGGVIKHVRNRANRNAGHLGNLLHVGHGVFSGGCLQLSGRRMNLARNLLNYTA
jgi:hypothetical protein